MLVQSVSSVSSLLSLAWSLTSYQRTLRYAAPDKPQMSVGASATTFLWHTFQVAARVIALALFGNAYKLEVFILLGVHWALMTVWVLAQVCYIVVLTEPVEFYLSPIIILLLCYQRTNFCGTPDGERKQFAEFFYNIVIGWVYTFVMINVKAAATRLKYAVFYVIIAIENTAMIVLWFLRPESVDHWYHFPALIATCVCFALSLVFMCLYYRHYHPDGKMPKQNESPKLF